MHKCVFLLLPIAALTAACAEPSPPTPRTPEEATVQPLVIGHSPETPALGVATAPDESAAPTDAPIAENAPSSLAVRARDPRLAAARTRARALVVTEIQQLEVLFGSTPTSSPARPSLARRLADDYVELARTDDGAIMKAARKSAIKYYAVIATDHAQDPHVDEALYYGALEQELAGDLTAARRGFFDLIRRAPQSKLIALSYFAFGEMFFTEAAHDPSKNDLAAQAFKEVLKYPAPANTVYADALLRMAQVHDRKGDAAQAAAMLAKLRRDFPNSEAARAAGSLPGASAPITRP